MSTRDSGAALPVIVGLAVGVAFVLLVAYFADYSNQNQIVVGGVLPDFKAPNQLPEVKLFLSNYPLNNVSAAGFGRNPIDNTIQFDYATEKTVHVNENYDTVHRLDLFILYDESHGFVQNTPNAKHLRIHLVCTEPSSFNPNNWQIVWSADNEHVLDNLQHNPCIY